MKLKLTSILLILLLTSCGDKWKPLLVAFEAGAPIVITRFEQSGKLTPEESTRLLNEINPAATDIRNKDWDNLLKRLGRLAKIRIANSEAAQWKKDLVNVAASILGVPIEQVIDDRPQPKGMKAKPKVKPNLSDENLKELERIMTVPSESSVDGFGYWIGRRGEARK